MIDLNGLYWLKYDSRRDAEETQQGSLLPTALINYYEVPCTYIKHIMEYPSGADLTWGLGNSDPRNIIAEFAWFIATQLCAGQVSDKARHAVTLAENWIEVYEMVDLNYTGKWPAHLGAKVDTKEFLKALVTMLIDAHGEALMELAEKVKSEGRE